VQELVAELRRLEDLQMHMANRIERSVYILQNSLRDVYVNNSMHRVVLGCLLSMSCGIDCTALD
jgi:hypothetical protein